jgi:hypothetical protein
VQLGRHSTDPAGPVGSLPGMGQHPFPPCWAVVLLQLGLHRSSIPTPFPSWARTAVPGWADLPPAPAGPGCSLLGGPRRPALHPGQAGLFASPAWAAAPAGPQATCPGWRALPAGPLAGLPGRASSACSRAAIFSHARLGRIRRIRPGWDSPSARHLPAPVGPSLSNPVGPGWDSPGPGQIITSWLDFTPLGRINPL